MAIIATGIDLAKNIFAVHGVNVGGTVLLESLGSSLATCLPAFAVKLRAR